MSDAGVRVGPDAAGERSAPSRWWIARPALIGACIAVPLLLAFLELAEDFRASARIERFDAAVSASVQAWRSAPLTAFFIGVTTLADSLTVWLLAAIVILLLLWWRRWSAAVLTFLAVAFGSLFGALAKIEVARARPPLARMLIALPGGYSFPSGHALAGVELYGVVAFLLVRELRVGWQKVLVAAAAVAIAVLIGVSRVYLGVHWPSDVLASWLLGGAWLALLCGGFATWERATGGSARG